jgi:NADH:ubiquinone oxidoreductase subunit 5 (subunit L)/multisubunit Na+/H+ antiporter MnhA subunit
MVFLIFGSLQHSANEDRRVQPMHGLMDMVGELYIGLVVGLLLLCPGPWWIHQSSMQKKNICSSNVNQHVHIASHSFQS